MAILRRLGGAALALVLAGAAGAGEGPSPIKFVMHRLGTFRSEACGVADFNGDGKLDVVAGPFLYLAPDWKPVKIRSLRGAVDDKGKGYYDDFTNLPLDVDGDGRPDLVSCGWFSTSVTWFRNTLGKETEWPLEQELKAANYECADLCDIDGDGKANEVLPHTAPTEWLEVGTLPDGKRGLVKHVVSAKAMPWGAGVGDVNGDGRPDILRPTAWFEGPADPRKGQWAEHPWALGAKDGKADHTPQILVFDVDGDKLNDVITSNAHKHGIFWYQQVREGDKATWKQHTIDDTWSQPHSLALADLDGDGVPELLAGKRFMAHNGGDPDAFGPLCLYYYKLTRGSALRQAQGGLSLPKAAVAWTRHSISHSKDIGAGMEICAVDLDGDGDTDIVVTGKWGGPVWFENKSK